MDSLLPIVHAIGTKPLTVSLAAQIIVIVLALKSQDKAQMAQSLTLMVGLLLAITSIALRPPSPVTLLPDSLGALAALFFVAPAVQSVHKWRQSQKGPKPV